MLNKKIYLFLLIAFISLYLLYPTIVIIVLRNFNMIISTILSTLIIMIFVIFMKKSNKKINTKVLLSIVLLLSIIVKLISVFTFKDVLQVSDFGKAFNTSISLQYTEYHRYFTHWILYPKILNIIFNIFGGNQLVLSVFNLITTCITSLLVYFIVNKITKNKKVSILCCSIYSFMPSAILYINICTQEHLAALFFCLAVLLILYLFDSIKNVYLKISLSILCGFILCIGDCFKQLSLILLIALFIYLLLEFISKKIFVKDVFKNIFIFLIIVISFSASKILIYNYFDNLVGKPVSRSSTSYFLTVGLNSNSKGFFSDEIGSNLYQKLDKYNYDYDKVNKVLKEELIDDINNNFFIIIRSIPNKLYESISKDKYSSVWLSEMTSDNSKKDLLNKFSYLTDTYYLVMILISGIGLIFIFLSKSKNLNKIVFIYIILFGYCLLMVLSEAQDRYKYPMMPLLSMATGISILEISKYKNKLK